MILTLDILKSKDPCKSGLEYYIKHPTDTVEKCIEGLMSENDDDCPDRWKWSYWLLTSFFINTNINFAIFAAEHVIDIFEKKYPDDMRPRNAIEVAKNYLKNTNDDIADAAYAAHAAAHDAAHDAAYAAAYAAYAAADAAYAAYAAADAAYAAADAAHAAAYAAADAAYAAAYDKNVKQKIINYGLKLLKEGEK